MSIPRAWVRGLGTVATRWALLGACGFASLAPSLALAQDRTHVLIVVGLGGTSEFRETFHEQAAALRTALVDQHGVLDEDIVYLGERVEIDPAVIQERATRDNVLATLAATAEGAHETDRVLIVLIGHGTSGPGGETFNLPGPDIDPADLATALDAFQTREVAFVHTGSGSGAFLKPLAGPNRVVITATRSARELNATRFGAHFVAAFTDGGSDIDRDGAVSLLEAFIYARDEVARHYETENQIQTEHAVLDGDGDGEGADEPTVDGPDGRLANRFVLGGGARTSVPDSDDPVLARLYRERAEIQQNIDELRRLSGTLDEEVYLSRIEDLLVELALKNREIEAAGGGRR